MAASTARVLNPYELAAERNVATGLRSVANALRNSNGVEGALLHGNVVRQTALQLTGIEQTLRDEPKSIAERVRIAQHIGKLAAQLTLVERRSAVDLWLLAADYYGHVLGAQAQAAILLQRAADLAAQFDSERSVALLEETSAQFERSGMYARAAEVEDVLLRRAKACAVWQYLQQMKTPIDYDSFCAHGVVYDYDGDDEAPVQPPKRTDSLRGAYSGLWLTQRSKRAEELKRKAQQYGQKL